MPERARHGRNSPSAHRHLPLIWLATSCSSSTSSQAGLPGVDAVGQVHHPVGAFAAGGAFAARFVLEEMHGLIDQPVDADRVVDDDDRGRAELGAQRRHAFVIHRGIQGLFVHDDQRRRAPAGMMALTFFGRQDAAAVLVDQLAEGGAQRQLVVAGRLTQPGEEKIFTPGLFSVPKDLYQSAPLAR
jgi:hypothetical protein